MSKNDQRIKDYRKTIEKRRSALGERPSVKYVTNGVLPLNGMNVNLNVLNTVDKCVDVLSQLIVVDESMDKASKLLGVKDHKRLIGNYTLADWTSDLKSRVKVLQWSDSEKSLKTAERKLSELLSEDAKTTEAIDDIVEGLEL